MRITLIIFLFIPFLIIAQMSSYKIMGKIIDGDSAEPLIGANILTIDSIIASYADLDGVFELSISSKTKIAKVRFMGYRPLCFFVSDTLKDTFLTLKLFPQEIDFGCIILYSQKALDEQDRQRRNGKADALNDLDNNKIALLQKYEVTDFQNTISKMYSFSFVKKNQLSEYLVSYNDIMLQYLKQKHGEPFINILNFMEWCIQ